MIEMDQAACDRIVERVTAAFRRDLKRIMRKETCEHDYGYSAKFGGEICSKCGGVQRPVSLKIHAGDGQ